jgi:hypothetical protein
VAIVDDFAERHPYGSGVDDDDRDSFVLGDLPALPDDVRLRVLAGALDPDAPPAPLDLLPADPELPDPTEEQPVVDADHSTDDHAGEFPTFPDTDGGHEPNLTHELDGHDVGGHDVGGHDLDGHTGGHESW